MTGLEGGSGAAGRGRGRGRQGVGASGRPGKALPLALAVWLYDGLSYRYVWTEYRVHSASGPLHVVGMCMHT